MQGYKQIVANIFWGLILAARLSIGCPPAGAQGDIQEQQYLTRGYFHIAVFSQDGRRLLTASGSTSTNIRPVAQLWDVDTGELVHQFLRLQSTIHSASFSSDGKRILFGTGNAGVVGSDEPRVEVVDAFTGEEIASLEANEKYVMTAQYSPDASQILAVSNSYRKGGDSAIVWDATSTRRQFVLSDVALHTRKGGVLEPVRFTPDGQSLVGLTSDGDEIAFWGAEAGQRIWRIDDAADDPGGTSPIGFGNLDFSTDGRLLLSVCTDNAVRIWDVVKRQQVHLLTGHRDSITAATFCVDGEKVISGSHDGTARLWDVSSQREVKQFNHSGIVSSIAVNSDSTRLVTKWGKSMEGTGERSWFASLWDIDSGRELKRFDRPSATGGRLLFSPDGQTLLVSWPSEKTFLINAKTGEVRQHYK